MSRKSKQFTIRNMHDSVVGCGGAYARTTKSTNLLEHHFYIFLSTFSSG
jgi:hypothetical protein